MPNPLHGKPVAQNLVASFIWQLIMWGGALLFGAITSYSSYNEGVPLYGALINGTVVFLGLALGGYFVSLIITKLRDSSQVTHSVREPTGASSNIEPATEVERGGIIMRGTASVHEPCPEQHLHDLAKTHEKTIEELNERVKELEEEKTALETTKDNDIKVHEESRRQLRMAQEDAATHYGRADTRDIEIEALKAKYEWLYEIAEVHRKDIYRFVRVTKITLGDVRLKHDMPFIRFNLYVTNDSIYDISVSNDYGGHIKFGSERLIGPKLTINNNMVNLSHTQSGFLTIEQRLSKEEAEHISKSENSPDANFYFDELAIPLVGGSRHPQVVRHALNITSVLHISGQQGPVLRIG